MERADINPSRGKGRGCGGEGGEMTGKCSLYFVWICAQLKLLGSVTVQERMNNGG